jgi:hypothetical protein
MGKKRPVAVAVTNDHLRYWIGNDKMACPLTGAVRDALIDQGIWATHIKVTQDTIEFSVKDEGVRYIFDTPPAAADFVEVIDSGKKPRLVNLTLDWNEATTKPMATGQRSYPSSPRTRSASSGPRVPRNRREPRGRWVSALAEAE